jgi:hypothetical protein
VTTLKFQAIDANQTVVSTVHTITITVANVNHAPSGADKTIPLNEDQSYFLSISDFGFRDLLDFPSHNLLSVRFPVAPVGGSLHLNSQPLTNFPAVISIINFFAGSVRFVPSADMNSSSSPLIGFTFQVQDNGGVAGGGIDTDPIARTIRFQVKPVNDPPSFAPGGDVSVTDESGPQALAGWALDVMSGPPNESSESARFVVWSNSNASLFSAPPTIDATGKLTFAPAPNALGVATLQIVLQDDGGTANGGLDASQPRTLNIRVTKARPGHNAAEATDATGDGQTTSNDALAIINFINAFGAGQVSNEGALPEPYCDVDGNGFITSRDALEVINQINASGLPPEQSDATSPLGATTQPPSDMLLALLACDIASQPKRRNC